MEETDTLIQECPVNFLNSPGLLGESDRNLRMSSTIHEMYNYWKIRDNLYFATQLTGELWERI